MKHFTGEVAILQWLILPFVFGLVLFGYTLSDVPTDSRRGESELPAFLLESGTSFSKSKPLESDSGNSLPSIILYSENFNVANDTTSLKARGYKIYYRGTGPQGLTATWFQGSSIVFSSLNGPSTGYVAANFNAVTSSNNIDNWLVLPKLNTLPGDSIYFFSRSILNSRFPDSIKVMFSQSGDSVPEAVWTELGRFKVNTAGSWMRKGFRAPSSGPGARYAIRYNVVNGGPSGVNSDYIGIDSLTVERPVIFPNNMQAVSVAGISTVIPADGSVLAPKGKFTNIGSNVLNSVSVKLSITGPVNYNSNKAISSIAPGDTVTVTFDSTFVPAIGSYTAKAISSLSNDTNRFNDTASLSFTAQQINFGSGGSYFYSNSIGSGAPAKPQFCWKDTTGSISLIVNSNIVRPELLSGNGDNGYFRLGDILKQTTAVKAGNEYDSIFIGTNGIIGFTQSNINLSNPNPDTSSVPYPALFPLWMDLSYSVISMTHNRLSYKVIDDSFILITYDRASVVGGNTGDYVSFQVLIDLMDFFSTQNSRILVQYADTSGSRTGSSFRSKYFSGTLPSHLCGIALSQAQKCIYRYAGNGFVSTGGPLLSASPVSVQYGPDAGKLYYSCSSATLQFTGSLEAITPDAFPSSNTADTILLKLRESTFPYEPVDAGKKMISNSGNGTFLLTNIRPGASYYLVVNHRSSVETWSSAPVNIPSAGATVIYNFTTGLNKAFGNNMVLISGAASFYSGDVNQDYSVDGTDLSSVDNDVTSFVTGYVTTDLNNDDIVDGSDAAFVDNNASNFISMVRP